MSRPGSLVAHTVSGQPLPKVGEWVDAMVHDPGNGNGAVTRVKALGYRGRIVDVATDAGPTSWSIEDFVYRIESAVYAPLWSMSAKGRGKRAPKKGVAMAAVDILDLWTK